jgi:hypothetical protein
LETIIKKHRCTYEQKRDNRMSDPSDLPSLIDSVQGELSAENNVLSHACHVASFLTESGSTLSQIKDQLSQWISNEQLVADYTDVIGALLKQKKKKRVKLVNSVALLNKADELVMRVVNQLDILGFPQEVSDSFILRWKTFRRNLLQFIQATDAEILDSKQERREGGRFGESTLLERRNLDTRNSLFNSVGELFSSAQEVDVLINESILENESASEQESGFCLSPVRDEMEEESIGSDVDEIEEEEDFDPFPPFTDPFVTEEYSDAILRVQGDSEDHAWEMIALLGDYKVAHAEYNYLVKSMNKDAWRRDNPEAELPKIESEEHLPAVHEIDHEMLENLLENVDELKGYDISAESFLYGNCLKNKDKLCALTGARAPFVSDDILGLKNRFSSPDAAIQYAFENPNHTRFIHALSDVAPLAKVGVWQTPSSTKLPMVLLVADGTGRVSRVTRGNPAKDMIHAACNSIHRSILPNDPGLKSPIPKGRYLVSVDFTTAGKLLDAKQKGISSKVAEGWKRTSLKCIEAPRVLVKDGFRVGESVIIKNNCEENAHCFPAEGVACAVISNPLGERDQVESSFYRMRSGGKDGEMHTLEIATNSGGVLTLHLIESNVDSFGRPITNKKVKYSLHHVEYFVPDQNSMLPHEERALLHETDVIMDDLQGEGVSPLTKEELGDIAAGYGVEKKIDVDYDSDIHSELSDIGDELFESCLHLAHNINSKADDGIIVGEEEGFIAKKLRDEGCIEDCLHESALDKTRLLKYVLVDEQQIEDDEQDLETENLYLDNLAQIREDLESILCKNVCDEDCIGDATKEIDAVILEELQSLHGVHCCRLNKIDRRLDVATEVGDQVCIDRLLSLKRERERKIKQNLCSQEIKQHMMNEREIICGVQKHIETDQTSQWKDLIDSLDEMAKNDKKKELLANQILQREGLNITLHADMDDLLERIDDVKENMKEEREFVDVEQSYDGSDHLYTKETRNELHNLRIIAKGLCTNSKSAGSEECFRIASIILDGVQDLIIEAEEDNQELYKEISASVRSKTSSTKNPSSQSRKRRSLLSRVRRGRSGRKRTDGRRGRSSSRGSGRPQSRSRERRPSGTRPSSGRFQNLLRKFRGRRTREGVTNDRFRSSQGQQRQASRQSRPDFDRSQQRPLPRQGSQRPLPRQGSQRPLPRQGSQRPLPRQGSQRPLGTRPLSTPPPSRATQPRLQQGGQRRRAVDRIPGVSGFRTQFNRRPDVLRSQRRTPTPQRGQTRTPQRRQTPTPQRRAPLSRREAQRRREFNNQVDSLDRQRRLGQITNAQFDSRLQALEQNRQEALVFVNPGEQRVVAVRRQTPPQSSIPPREFDATDNFDEGIFPGTILRPNENSLRRGDLFLVSSRQTLADLPVVDIREDGSLNRTSLNDITGNSLVSDFDAALSFASEQGLMDDDGQFVGSFYEQEEDGF